MNDNKYNYHLDFVNRLTNNDALFNEEFVKMKNDFPFQNHDEIYDFFSENRGLIVLLEEVKPLLKKHVPYASFHLELDVDPLFGSQLLLVVKALDYDFNNGFKDDISIIDQKIDELVLKLDLGCEFFIFDTSCNIGGKNALSLKEVSRHYSGYYNH